MTDIDIKLTQDETGLFDISFDDDGDFTKVDGFDTSLIISVYADKRASKSEVPYALYRSGWIGNSYKDFEIGSKVWIYLRSRLTNSNIESIKKAATDSLQWLISDSLAKNVQVEIISVTSVKISLKIVIEFSNGIIEDKYYDLWLNTGV